MKALFPDLNGKTAIITGVSRGIGAGIAKVLGAQGMTLVLSARTDKDGRLLRDKLAETGVKAVWVASDLTLADDAQRVIDACLDPPNILVNNAAILRSKPAQYFDREEMEQSLMSNLKILHHITYLAINRMKETGVGNIINISSVGAQRGHRDHCGYDSYKGAMDSFTRSAALDLAPFGIRVNGIAPGATVNREGQSLTNSVTPGIPRGRMGTKEDVGNAVAFLASECASYITGHILAVDGGLLAQLTPPGIYI